MRLYSWFDNIVKQSPLQRVSLLNRMKRCLSLEGLTKMWSTWTRYATGYSALGWLETGVSAGARVEKRPVTCASVMTPCNPLKQEEECVPLGRPSLDCQTPTRLSNYAGTLLAGILIPRCLRSRTRIDFVIKTTMRAIHWASLTGHSKKCHSKKNRLNEKMRDRC
jgi:hypothetical protein